MSHDTESLQELRVAVFGARGSGKTSLLSSYFGHLQGHDFEQKSGYRLTANDVAVSNALLGNFYGMQEGAFPEGTVGHETYSFDFDVTGCSRPAFRVLWTDYPGGWWSEQPKDAEERRHWASCLSDLCQAHVGIVLIDGAKYAAERGKYLRQVLDQFRNVIRVLSSASTDGEQPGIATWVLALSKADLHPNLAAEEFGRRCVKDADQQIRGLAKQLNTRRFGHLYLLLSAAHGADQRVVDIHKTRGLNLLAPVAFQGVLEYIAIEANRAIPDGNGAWWFRLIRGLVDLVDHLDDFLPPKYQVLTKLIGAFGVRDAIEKQVEWYRGEQARLAMEGSALEAGAMALKAELSDPDNAKDFHQNQHVD